MTISGEDLLFLNDSQEVSSRWRSISLAFAAVVLLIGLFLSIAAPTIFGIAGRMLGSLFASGLLYWFMLRIPSQPRTVRLCPECGEAELVEPQIDSEPDGPYCPESGCDFVAQPD